MMTFRIHLSGTGSPLRWVLPGAAAVLSGLPAAAQQARLDDLERRLDLLEEDHAAELEALQQQLDEAIHRAEAARAPSGQALNIFNPSITVTGTFTGRTDSIKAFEGDNPAAPRLDERFSLREAEIDLRAPVGPWADGVLTLAIEPADVDHDFSAGIEEGYVSLRRLPFWESNPGGLQIKAGQFRVNFNQLNRVHLHDLPQATYPRSLQQFLGHHGFMQTGISAQFFLPSPSDSVSLQGTIEILNGGDVPPQTTSETTDTGALGQLRSFVELSPSRTFDLGGTVWSDGPDRSMYGVDLTYEWLPPSQGTWTSFLLSSELIVGDFDQVGLDKDPLGYHVAAQYQFDSSTYFGVRYDYSEELNDADLQTRVYGAYLTRYAAEFLRFRLGYEHADSDLSLIDGRDTGFFEVNFIYGAHPPNIYWVHR